MADSYDPRDSAILPRPTTAQRDAAVAAHAPAPGIVGRILGGGKKK